MNVWLAFYCGVVLGVFCGLFLAGLLSMAKGKPPIDQNLWRFPGHKFNQEDYMQPLEDPMCLVALYLAEFNKLTTRERIRAGWYAAIILAPLAAIILAHHLYGPSLG